jgi:hypothetical protein
VLRLNQWRTFKKTTKVTTTGTRSCAIKYCNDTCVGTEAIVEKLSFGFNIESDDVKGRIIGLNTQHLKVTGVEIIVDDKFRS